MFTHINIVHTGSEFFKQEFHQLRLGFVTDALMVIGTTVAVLNGVVPISEDDLAQAGIQLINDQD